MPLYKRAEVEDELDTTNDPITSPVIVDDDQTWKQRYGNLRSYAQKQVNELTKKVQALEARVAKGPETQLPKTREEVQEWASKYPDVYALLKSIIGLDLQQVTEEVNQRFQTLEEREIELNTKTAHQTLEKLQPDFFTIIQQSEEFGAWLDSQPESLQKIMTEGDDPYAASRVIDIYKVDTGFGKKKVAVDPRAPARNVKLNTHINPNITATTGEYDFSESQIAAMKDHEFNANEEAIDRARRSGRILMDITGAAR